MTKVIGMAVVVLGLAVGSAWADSTHTCQGNSCNGGGTSAEASATAVGVGIGGGANVSNHNTNVGINTQGQHQSQGQYQGQAQGQQQGQNNAQTISPAQSTKINVDAPLIPGVAVAPGLTSGGSQVCLGSFSVGLSGPMAGVAFGKTVVDKGCERRQNAILLFNMGYKAEALELLKGDESVAGLFVAPKPTTARMEAPMTPVAMVTPGVPTMHVVEVQGN